MKLLTWRALGDPRGLWAVLHFVQDDDVSCMACRQAHLKESGNRVDGEREDDDVERKRENAMEQRELTNAARCDLHIRDLTGHADDEREIGKIEIIGQPFARKIEAASVLMIRRIIAVAIKSVRVMQTKNGVGERPRSNYGQQTDDQMSGEMATWFSAIGVQQKADGEQSRARRDYDKDKNQFATQVLRLGARPNFFTRRRDDRDPGQCQHANGERIPRSHGTGPKTSVTAQQIENCSTNGDRNEEAMMCV